MAKTTSPWDTSKFENTHQIGGITLAKVAPAFGGDIDNGCRVAQVNTGAGLRFTVALDRGGDIVDASFNDTSLTYLSPNGLKAPDFGYAPGLGWLRNWAGGLVTTCGPRTIGYGDYETGLHGRYSNEPAHVEMLLNPDLHGGRREMLLSMVTRDSRVFGPTLEVRRQIQCRLGEPQIVIFDQVTNRGDETVDHNWLYHVNLGYPLLDKGAQFIYRGKAEYWQRPDQPDKQPTAAALKRLKRVTDPLPEHTGMGERGLLVEAKPDRQGIVHAGIINRPRKLALELTYQGDQLPRLANWQHYGPRGSYVAGVEPFNGSLMGLANDAHPRAKVTLEPGQSIRYQLTLTVHHTPAAIASFAKHDGDVTAK